MATEIGKDARAPMALRVDLMLRAIMEVDPHRVVLHSKRRNAEDSWLHYYIADTQERYTLSMRDESIQIATLKGCKRCWSYIFHGSASRGIRQYPESAYHHVPR